MRLAADVGYVGVVWAVTVIPPRDPAAGARIVTVLGGLRALVPVLTRRRPRRPGGSWPPGSEAFAVLSVLDRATWVEPRRLGELAHLPPVIRDQWLDTLRSRGWVTGGRERRWGSPSPVRITSLGVDEPATWRRRLEALAAPSEGEDRT